MTAEVVRLPDGPRPSWATRRDPSRRSFGPAVAQLAEHAGTPLFGWQRHVVDVALELDPDGSWHYREIVITVPRRSGKSFLIAPVTAHRGLAMPTLQQIWITAQTRVNAVDRWRDSSDWMFNSGLRSMLHRVNTTGNERVDFPNASFFRPFAPTPAAMHGADPTMVWVDELWHFDLQQKRAVEQGYKPNFVFKPGQAWLMSTAGTADSAWLNQLRREGRDRVEKGDNSTRSAYFEWSAPRSVGGKPIAELSPDDMLDAVFQAHPRRDHGLTRASLRDELTDDTAAFLRAYGNLTDDGETVSAILSPEQLDRASRGSRIPDDARVSLGVAVHPDGADAAIAVCWRRPDGVRVVTARKTKGTRWVAPELERLHNERSVALVGFRAASAAREIADDVESRGVPVLKIAAPDWSAAGARFVSEVSEREPSVRFTAAHEIRTAIGAAASKQQQSGTTFVSRQGDSITALDAAVGAVWAVDHAPVLEIVPDPVIW